MGDQVGVVTASSTRLGGGYLIYHTVGYETYRCLSNTSSLSMAEPYRVKVQLLMTPLSSEGWEMKQERGEKGTGCGLR